MPSVIGSPRPSKTQGVPPSKFQRGDVAVAKSVIAYDKELPEIPGAALGEADVVPGQGRRGADRLARRHVRAPGEPLLLVSKMRKAVDRWRDEGYPGASQVTQRLFQYWFEEEHEVAGSILRYRFCLREAIETLVFLIEIANNRDCKALIEEYAEVVPTGLYSTSIEFQTTMDGRRQTAAVCPGA